MNNTIGRVWNCVKQALPKAGKTCIWLFKIILPISLLVRLLQYSGLLGDFSVILQPLFSLIGLPGETAIVFITSVFCPLYAPIALITSMSLGLREATILALMCLISHNLIVESTVQSKTGSSFWQITIIRLCMSFVIAFFLHALLPVEGWGEIAFSQGAESCNTISEVLLLWLTSSIKVILTIFLIVTALMILHYILEEFRLIKGLSSLLAPLMKLFGLPKDTAFLWLVGNIVGLAYGSAIMISQIEQKKLSMENGKLLNYHLSICHSLLEDTLIFIAIGIPLFWLVSTRLLFAILLVWGYRSLHYFYIKKIKPLYE